MPRSLATFLLALAVLAGALAAPPAAPAGAGQRTTTTAVEGGDIIPEPNSGEAPDDAGDRGGSLQTALFVGIVVAFVGGGAVLVVQSRRARAGRGF